MSFLFRYATFLCPFYKKTFWRWIFLLCVLCLRPCLPLHTPLHTSAKFVSSNLAYITFGYLVMTSKSGLLLIFWGLWILTINTSHHLRVFGYKVLILSIYHRSSCHETIEAIVMCTTYTTKEWLCIT